MVALILLITGVEVPSAVAQQLDRVESEVVREARADYHGPDLQGKDGPLSTVGMELALLYREHRQFEASGAETFEPQSIPTPSQSGSSTLSKDGASRAPNPDGYLSPVRGESVYIDAIPQGSPSTLARALKKMGAEQVAHYANLVSARVPIDRIPDLAALSSLQNARAAHAEVKSRSVSPGLRTWLERSAAGEVSGTSPMPGNVVSQGDEAMNTDDVRSSFNIDGAGVEIGVLSDSYNADASAATSAEDDINNGDLPPAFRIDVLEDLDSGTDEGRGMMQLIYDVAPGADLTFHTAFGGRANFAQGIIDLANAGADVTVDDIGYFVEPFFQDGPIAQAVNTVSSNGVPHFASAGNDGDRSYESDSWNAALGKDGTPAYDFDSSASVDTMQSVTIGAASEFGTARIILQWDDPAASASSSSPGADTDLDLLLYDSSGTLVASSAVDNIGGDPVEVLQYNSFVSANYEIKITKHAGPDPGRIKYVHSGAVVVNEYETNSSTSVGHNNATGGAGVAAAFYDETPAFGTDPALAEPFTSLGGTPILFNVDGTRKSSSDVRDQPRFTGPDGTNTTFFGSDISEDSDNYPNFFGTSAAAPHVAALAALQLQADPSLSPSQIYTDLSNGAEDMTPSSVSNPSGFDHLTGAGLVNAQNTITSATGDQNIELVTSTSPNFGQRFFDQSTGSLFSTPGKTVEIVNAGNSDLDITNLSISGSAFAFASGSAISSGTLAPSERATGTLIFDPSSTGSFSETLTINSNDPDEGTITINLAGEAILPPVADVSVSSLFEAVETGNTATQTFTVSNTGDNPLEYDVFAEALGLGPFTPSEIASPPTSSASSAAKQSSMQVQSLRAPQRPTAKQAFDASEFIYTLDDGSAETGLGIGSNADVFWLNAFQAKEGATTITALASAFGSSQPVGSNVELLLYEDPNDDGDPTDATLLQTVSTTTEVSGGGTLQIEPIPPTTVEGVFFVAALVPSTAQYPAPLDETSDRGASWFASADPTDFNTADLSGGGTQSAPSLTANVGSGFPGNWVLRAQGAYAAFEPVSGTVNAGNSNNVDVTFDGTSLPTGRYQANAAVASNDPATPKVDVPFTFFVADAVGEATLSASTTSATFDDTGVEVNLNNVSGTGTVTAMRFDDAPSNVSGLATGESVSEFRWFIHDGGNVTFDGSSELRFLRADIPTPGFDPSNADDVTVYRRSDFGSGTFSSSALTSSFDNGETSGDLSDDAIVATGATDFSEFTFASDSAPLPVDVASLDATQDDGDIVLSWRTTSETNNAGFRLERKAKNESRWTDVGALIEGQGTTSEVQTYQYRVENMDPNTYTFRLKSISTNGTEEVGPSTSVEVEMKSAYTVSSVHPNPVSTHGRFEVQVRKKQEVQVVLYNVLGQKVRTLHDGVLNGNTPHTVSVNSSSLASGVYFVRVRGKSFQTTRKLTLAQ